MWQVEQVPDGDFLFTAVHEMWFRDGAILPGAFKNHGDGMSTDWSKYSTARKTQQRRSQPEKNAVVQLSVQRVRAIPRQRVEHTPFQDNQAHTDVFGEKDTEVRILLRRAADVILPLCAR